MSKRTKTMAERLGARIERARRMRGESLRSLADLLEGKYSHTTLQKYEKGVLCPDIEAIGLIARALDLRPDYFMKENEFKLEAVEYRKLSKLGKKFQKQIEEEAFEFFERYLEIENILSLPPEELPRFDLSSTSQERLGQSIEDTANKLREVWDLGLDAIPNVHTMLEEHGVKVKVLDDWDGFDGFSALARTGEKEIATMALSRKAAKDTTRFRFTALHELAHLVTNLPGFMKAAEIERACHRFAGALLIPESAFIEMFGRNRTKISVAELVAIKEAWGISCMAIMARARDLNLISAGRYKSFCILANKWGWRKEKPGEPGKWIGDEKSGRFKQLVMRALSSEVITASKACGLLDWTQGELAKNYELIEA